VSTSAGSQPLRRWWRRWSQLRRGTILIVNVEDRAATLAFTQNEPFHQVSVFESVVVRRWRQMQLEVSLGANAGTAIAMYLQEEVQ
jgi:hypothetical protein